MIYAFQCTSCGARFDVAESLSEHERHREKCPKCASKTIERRFTSGVLVKTSKKS